MWVMRHSLNLLFMVPDGLITVSIIVLKEIFDFLAT